jgi:hypothetical protein
MEDKDFKDAMNKAMDYLYEYYEADHSMRVCVSLRPSEPWHDIPEELLSKEQFFKTLDERWELAFNILSNYISKHNRDAV